MTEPEKTALDKIKKLEDQIAKKKALLIREKGRVSEKERRARIRKLIEVGSFFETAGLLDSDQGFLLGVLLQAASLSPTSARYEDLKHKGDELLKESENARKKKNG
jgi:hypothetical protein